MSFPILGLTGPSGAGKGALAQYLHSTYGFAWIDTDRIYHSLVSAPSPCLDELEQAFGKGVIKHGALDRPALAAIVFAQDAQDKLLLLNRITHKHVIAYSRTEIESARLGGARGAIIDAPLLFEAGADALCTHTLAVLASPEARLARITSRDGIDTQYAQKRMNAQPTDDFYKEHATFVIYNNQALAELYAQADRLVKEIL